MPATGDEVASIAQAAEALGIEAQTSGATGGEAVRLRQLKMLRDSGAGGKRYKIEASSSFPTSVQPSACAGDVVITAAGDGVVSYSVYESDANGPVILYGKESSQIASIDELPKVVQDALANIPETMAGPITRPGYSWFIMPPCDVFLMSY